MRANSSGGIEGLRLEVNPAVIAAPANAPTTRTSKIRNKRRNLDFDLIGAVF
jgi:hypothetical protein